MALPENMGTGTVTGTILDEDGNPVSGSVTFDPRPNYLVNAGADRIIGLGSTTVTLTAGAFTATLIATDDEDCAPVDWTYAVSFKLSGVPSIGGFDIEVPEGSSVDLADISPSAVSGGQAIVRGAGVPPGGTTGQVLAKASGADDDTEWISVDGITPPTVAELSDTNVADVEDGQTIVWDAGNGEWIPGTPSGGVSSWDDLTGKPSTFAPSAHTHSTSDVSGLDTALSDLVSDVGGLEADLAGKADISFDGTMRFRGFGAALPVSGNQDGDIFFLVGDA